MSDGLGAYLIEDRDEALLDEAASPEYEEYVLLLPE